MLGTLGALTNSGSMPINAGGGSAGPSSAQARNSIGGSATGNVSFGSTPVNSLAMLGLAGLVIWLVVRK